LLANLVMMNGSVNRAYYERERRAGDCVNRVCSISKASRQDTEPLHKNNGGTHYQEHSGVGEVHGSYKSHERDVERRIAETEQVSPLFRNVLKFFHLKRLEKEIDKAESNAEAQFADAINNLIATTQKPRKGTKTNGSY
jgi:hypothetical protein